MPDLPLVNSPVKTRQQYMYWKPLMSGEEYLAAVLGFTAKYTPSPYTA